MGKSQILQRICEYNCVNTYTIESRSIGRDRDVGLRGSAHLPRTDLPPAKKRLREGLQRIPHAREAGGVRGEAEDRVRGERPEDRDPAAVGSVRGHAVRAHARRGLLLGQRRRAVARGDLRGELEVDLEREVEHELVGLGRQDQLGGRLDLQAARRGLARTQPARTHLVRGRVGVRVRVRVRVIVGSGG